MRTSLIILGLEVGVFLVILPWVRLWDQNFFAGQYHWVAVVMRNNYVRGAVSGIGLSDIWVALQEAWGLHTLADGR